MEDETLQSIRRAVDDTLRGDPNAYAVLVDTYMQTLYRTALGLTREEFAAQDLVQETFIDGYLHLSELRDPQKIEGWLRRILKNKALNYLTRTRRTEPESVLENRSDRRSPESAALQKETMLRYREMLRALSPALRTTARMYFWEGCTMEEIARRTDTPPGTVKRRIHDIRLKWKKENEMKNEVCTLPDGFAEALKKKIVELENYTKTYGSAGFDTAHKNVKELIAELSDRESVRQYSVKSAEIAAHADCGKYAEEALAVYKKYGDVIRAGWLYLDLCWKEKDSAKRLAYTSDVILPALAEYPESELRAHEIGYHYFWMAQYTDNSTPEGIARAQEYIDAALQQYAKTTAVDASCANTAAAQKALQCLRDNRVMRHLMVTGETWKIADGNVYYYNQPGCGYSDSSLYKYMNYIFWTAGSMGDGWFFPRTVPLQAGAEEKMAGRRGKAAGVRQVIAADETVVTPAGTFENCLRIRKTDAEGDSTDAWYCAGVGLVKITTGNDAETKVLSSYEIRGGEGYLPVAAGNRWCYETPDRPDVLFERNEYVVERMGAFYDAEAVPETTACVSCLNYFAMEPDWDSRTDDPALLLMAASELCDQKKYSEAADKLRQVILANRSRESVDVALSLLAYLEEKLPTDALDWRWCPSSANISTVTVEENAIRYGESGYCSLDTGVWGSRREEDQIFGVKPFRYLQSLCGGLWDDRWIPGFTESRTYGWDTEVQLTVSEGGTVKTPAGTFENTLRISVSAAAPGNPDDYKFYFYSHPECGQKDFWLAEGVGVVRFACVWGKHRTADALLTGYRTVAAPKEWMPIHPGCRWSYDEQNLTAENYLARREYEVLGGHGGQYLLGDHQKFTWKGSRAEYEAFKQSLKK
ncbi:MAG: sigma-70 family RNA polymerase sigma factor [Clostridia bacterium]|nr:sigma-70 family RNA polymerase sigma factor [Clostridia bacterium]